MNTELEIAISRASQRYDFVFETGLQRIRFAPLRLCVFALKEFVLLHQCCQGG
jgi:hypothetical protein